MKKLLLLHGAIGSSGQIEPLAEKLKDKFDIYLLNFSGHGGKSVPAEPFSMAMFADDIIYFIKKNRLEGINIYGYSMGGYAALYAARHNTGLINKIFTTATKFNWNEETSIKESLLLDPDKIKEKIPKFAEQLSERHAPEDWKIILKKTAEMMISLGKNNVLKDKDISLIENKVLVSAGDRDNMVSVEETAEAYRKLKNGSLLILPNTAHPIEKINLDRLSGEIEMFFGN